MIGCGLTDILWNLRSKGEKIRDWSFTCYHFCFFSSISNSLLFFFFFPHILQQNVFFFPTSVCNTLLSYTLVIDLRDARNNLMICFFG